MWERAFSHLKLHNKLREDIIWLFRHFLIYVMHMYKVYLSEFASIPLNYMQTPTMNFSYFLHFDLLNILLKGFCYICSIIAKFHLLRYLKNCQLALPVLILNHQSLCYGHKNSGRASVVKQVSRADTIQCTKTLCVVGHQQEIAARSMGIHQYFCISTTAIAAESLF